MTNKEAIEELKGLQKFINGTRLNGEIRVEALDLAIKALEDAERLVDENHRNFVNSQHIISLLVDEIRKLREEKMKKGGAE